MKTLYTQIKKKILAKYPDTIAIIVHGSAINGNLKDYSDIDLNVFLPRDAEHPFEYEIMEYGGRKILMNMHFANYKKELESLKNEAHAEQVLVNYISYMKILVLYDKIGIEKKLKSIIGKAFKKSDHKKFLFIKFCIMIDFFFKLKRSYNKDSAKVMYSARIIAGNAARVIQFFNELKPEERYTSILSNYDAIHNFKNVPRHFKEDFVICMGLKENLSVKQIYDSGIRIVKETVEFLGRQNLKEIKKKEFFDLLEQAGNLF